MEESLKNKRELRKMLSRHPEWDGGSMRIIMPIESNGERLDVSCKMAGFRLMCNGIDTSPLEVFEFNISFNKGRHVNAERL